MDQEALDRARARLEEAAEHRNSGATELGETIERARAGIEDLAQTAAELEARIPADVQKSIEEGMRKEVLPVGRHIAELRGLAAQTIRRLDRLQSAVDAERRARIEDLALMVEVISSGWQGIEQRLERIEGAVQRPEQNSASSGIRASEVEPGTVYRIEEHTELHSPA